MDEIASLLTTYHDEMGMPYALANAPGVKGFGTHAMGGQSWGGHPCPGPIRTLQRSTMLAKAQGGGSVTAPTAVQNATATLTLDGIIPAPNLNRPPVPGQLGDYVSLASEVNWQAQQIKDMQKDLSTIIAALPTLAKKSDLDQILTAVQAIAVAVAKLETGAPSGPIPFNGTVVIGGTA
jgi:hypothetical protein